VQPSATPTESPTQGPTDTPTQAPSQTPTNTPTTARRRFLSSRRRYNADDTYEILYTIYVDNEESADALVDSVDADDLEERLGEAISDDLSIAVANFTIQGTAI